MKKEVDEDVDWEVEMVDEWLEVLETAICFNRCTWLASYYKEMRIKEKSKSFRHVDPFPRASDVLSRREELCFIMQTRQFHRRVDSPRQN